MSEYHPENASINNEESLRSLGRSLSLSRGQFSLILARCNSAQLRQRLIAQLRASSEVDFQEFLLEPSAESIEAILPEKILPEKIAGQMPQAVMISGLESVEDLDGLLAATNNARDELGKYWSFPLVLWTTDRVLRKLIRVAPDFESWASTPIEFENSAEELADFLRQTADRIFTTVLAAGADGLANNAANLDTGSHRRLELEFARQELQRRGVELEPELEASLEFVMGRDAGIAREQSRQHYDRSLKLWALEVSPESPQKRRGEAFQQNLGQNNEISNPNASPSPNLSPSPEPSEPPQERRGEAFQQNLEQSNEISNPNASPSPNSSPSPESSEPPQERRGEAFRQDLGEKPETSNPGEALPQDLAAQIPPQSPLKKGGDPESIAPLSKGGWGDSPSPLQNLQREGVLLFYLGRWWQQEALLDRAEELAACSQAKNYFRQSIDRFRQAQRPDLVAKFINPLAEVLQKLAAWDELEAIAAESLELHQTYPVTFGETRDYGFLAEVALARARGEAGKEYAQKALQYLPEIGENAAEKTEKADAGEANANFSAYFNLAQHYLGWVLLLLARAEEQLGNIAEAIAYLERGRLGSHPRYNPLVYIEILEKLRSLYFKEGQYLQAFEAKQQKEATEHRFGLRAFIGAGRLEPQLEASNLAPAFAPEEKIASEIAASGRQQDVERLVARMDRDDLKLTIIHGQSGVGKSSLVQAGLIPALQKQTIRARKVLPVLQQVYNSWLPVLSRCLGRALGKAIAPSPEAILEQLRQNGDRNLLTVLIFDQFEEFFFDCQNQTQRLPFYEFLRQCLDIAYVKVILSLREDYLHYLLECNDRLVSLDAVNNNILDKKIIYYLGNFSPADASSVISSLTERSQFRLQPALIDELVRDLAGELNEVRPIELQVVGAQLQADNITTLESYRESGPKQRLVGKFLQDVVQYCGRENESMAKLFLYLLTDENNTRPLKTRADLELELETKPEVLDLILDVFVRSGLVLRQPAFPKDRYQLVHDYLVEFVRKQPESAPLFAELEKERKERKLAEARLIESQKKQLRAARRARNTLVGLLGSVACFAAVATIGIINTSLTALTFSSADNAELDRVVSALRLGNKFKQLSMAALPETRLRVLTELNQAVAKVYEVNRLEGHTESVNWVTFSPDGNLLATASEDKTARIWQLDGTLLEILLDHNDIVTSVSFSPDGKRLASTSKDKTVKLWNLEGELLQTFEGHSGSVTRVAFSPDGKNLASASEDKTVKVWSIDDEKIVTLNVQSEGISSVRFSPDGKTIATASVNDIVRLWNLKGEQTGDIDQYGVIEIEFSPYGQLITAIDNNGWVKVWTKYGEFLEDIEVNLSSNQEHFRKAGFRYDGRLLAHVNERERQFSVSNKLIIGELGIYRINDNNTNIVKFLNNRLELNHGNSIECIVFSPNGQYIASGGKDKTVKIWSLPSGRYDLADIRSDKSLSLSDVNSSNSQARFNASGEVVGFDQEGLLKLWQHDGKLLTTIHARDSSPKFGPDNETILTRDYESESELWSVGGEDIDIKLGWHTDNVKRSISFSSDGQIVAAIRRDNTVKLWRRDGTLLATLSGHSDRVKTVYFSPDSKKIASIGVENAVKLWRIKDGTLIATLPGHANEIDRVTFSPDSQILATIGDEVAVKLWRTSDGTSIAKLPAHTNEVRHVTFSSDSQMLATTGDDNALKLWNVDGTLVRVLLGHTNRVADVRFSPDSQTLASISDEIIIWHRNGALLRTIEYFSSNRAYFMPDRPIIASAHYGSTIKLWDFKGNLIETLLRSNKGAIELFSVSPDSQKFVAVVYDNRLKIWQRGSKDPIVTKQAHGRPIKAISFSPDGQTIVSASDDKTVKLWRSSDGRLLKTLEAEENIYGFQEVRFSADGEIIALISSGYRHDRPYTVKFWNANGERIKTIQGRNRNVTLSPEGRRVIFFINKRLSLKIWRTEDGRPIATFKGHQDSINSASFSPDGKLVVSASEDKTIRIWRSRDGKWLRTIKANDDAVNSVRFSPDGETIVSASDDKTARIWKLDGTLLQTLEGHTDRVTSATFKPDDKTGKTIVSRSADSTLRFWRVSDGREIRKIQEPFEEYRAKVDDLNFSPDGKILAIGGDDANKVKLHILNWFDGIWFKETELVPVNSFSEEPIQPGGDVIAVTSPDGMLVLSLGIDDMMERACDWARDYLQNNVNVKESDKRLCDDVGTKERGN